MISDYFSSTDGLFKTKVGLKRGEAVALERSFGSWTVIGTWWGVKVGTVSAVRSNEIGKYEEIFRCALIRNHVHPGVLKHLQIQADDVGGVLRSLAILTVDALDIEMSKQLASLDLFCIRSEQEITKNFGEVMPVSILLSMDPTPVKVVALDKYSEMIKISVFDRRRRFTEQKISYQD